ncbi:hypothetical protein D3OALGA1CA_86 [Olavius algarvensis associated proteobacterium Delta 3]|nr:hypothetical protein D3OALGA1CA_86 [Olavius algarvensis associated proteobacterium Delta 3]
MAQHSHEFVETYDDLIGFGLDRTTDENTLIVYLQKFSDDALVQKLVPRMTDDELEALFHLMNRMMRKYLSDSEYHRLFLKEASH